VLQVLGANTKPLCRYQPVRCQEALSTPQRSCQIMNRRDAETVALALTQLQENNPFDHDRDKQLLVSFLTGFTCTANDGVDAERTAEVGRGGAEEAG